MINKNLHTMSSLTTITPRFLDFDIKPGDEILLRVKAVQERNPDVENMAVFISIDNGEERLVEQLFDVVLITRV